MDVSNGRRKPVRLSAETKWEIFLAIAQGEISQPHRPVPTYKSAVQTVLRRPLEPGEPTGPRSRQPVHGEASRATTDQDKLPGLLEKVQQRGPRLYSESVSKVVIIVSFDTHNCRSQAIFEYQNRARRGIRTLTPSRAADFESAASACSAIRAGFREAYRRPPGPVAGRTHGSHTVPSRLACGVSGPVGGQSMNRAHTAMSNCPETPTGRRESEQEPAWSIGGSSIAIRGIHR